MWCSLYLISTSGTRKRNELTDSAVWTEISGERERGGFIEDGDVLQTFILNCSVTAISM